MALNYPPGSQQGTGWLTRPPILYTPATKAPVYGLDNIAMLPPQVSPYSATPDIAQRHSPDIYASLVSPSLIMQLYRTMAIPSLPRTYAPTLTDSLLGYR